MPSELKFKYVTNPNRCWLDTSQDPPNGFDRLQGLAVYSEVLWEARVSIFWQVIFRAPSESPARKHVILYFRRAPRWGRWEIKKERRGGPAGDEGEVGEMERKEERWQRKKVRDSHTWFASSLGVSSGLQEENYCTSPRRARVTSLSTLINWKSVIAQTAPLSVC